MHPPFVVTTWPMAPLSGPPAELACRFRRAGWVLAQHRPGLAVWQRPGRPIPIRAGPDCLLLGRWSGDTAGLRETSSGGDATPADLARRLVRTGWGAFVALIPDRARAQWWAFRDPSGAVDALTWTSGDYAVLASGLADLPPGLLPDRLGLNWTVIADQLRRPVTQVSRSALCGVGVVAPGDLHRLGGPAEAALAVWRPAQFLPTGPDVVDSWPDQLADTVQSVVGALLRPYDRVVSEASGGLDSSVVNAAAFRAGTGDRLAAALHYVGDRPESDERYWANLLCESYGLTLASLPLATGPIDPDADFADLARDARPPHAAVDSERDRETARFLRDAGAQALVTGKGGDAVFFQMPSAAVLGDLWRAEGLRAARHPRHAEMAHWLRRSVWSLWREALKGPTPASGAGALGRLAGPGLGPPPGTPAHPWLCGLEDAPPGKQLQIEALANSQLALGHHRRGQVADLVQPLLSQPVMELCLSIPSWELVRGGRDRGLAREAFARWLPAPIAWRRSKGNLTAHYARRTAASAEVLKAHLLDGVLANAGLLDRRETESALQPDSLIWRADGIDLIGVAALESWVRYWQTRAPDAPRAGRPFAS